MLPLWVLLLPVLCCSAVDDNASSWFQSSCRPLPSACRCRTRETTFCEIGNASETTRQLTSCDALSHSLTYLNISCDQNQECDSVDVAQILLFFPDLLSLHLHGCAMDMKKYQVMRTDSTLLMNASLSRSLKSTTAFYFNLNLDLKLRYRQLPAGGLPSCNLLRLSITGARFTQLPIGFLSTCALLEQLTITGNQMNMLQELDVATLHSLRNLRLLNLGYNAIMEISPFLGKNGLQHIKDFLYYRLKTWVAQHNSSQLSPNERQAFNKLVTRFANWYDPLKPLTYPVLVSILEEVNLDMYFSINYSPLQELLLTNNQLSEISISLFGFNNLIQFHLGFNRLRYCLCEPQSITLHAFRKSLRTFKVNNNNISTIGYNGFKYLKDVTLVDVSHNFVNRLDPTSMPANSTINELFLNHNLLRHIWLQMPMPRLVALDLSYNRLIDLDRALAPSIPQIMFLKLDGNPMPSLTPFALYSLKYLHVLHMTNMSLNKMSAETYAMQPRSAPNRALVIIHSHKDVLMTCDCKSVFNAIALERNKVTNFTYPNIGFLKSQFCRSPYDGKKWIPISDQRTYDCFFRNMYCLDSCGCCQEHHYCGCRYECPSGCTCSYTSKLTDFKVDCRMLNLTLIPNIQFPIYYLLLQDNEIDAIAPNSFTRNLSSLVSLHIRSNKLQIIGPHTFQHLTKLRFLDLSHNLISIIDAQAFVSDVPSLSILDLDHNSLSSLQKAPFQPLTKLTRLRLSSNSLICDCFDLLHFLHYKKTGGSSRDLLINMADKCLDRQTGKNVSLCSLRSICAARSAAVAAEKRLQRWRIHIGLSSGGGMLVILLLLLLLSHQRYRLRVRLDSAVRSALGRSLLRLSPANRTCRLDVAFLVHERQAEQFRAMQRRLQTSPRRALTTAWLADHMPGALRLSAAANLAAEAATCVVLLSEDLLDDAVCAESLRLLLTRAIEHRLQLVPVLLCARVTAHELWPPLGLLLRHWPLLRWGQPFFWERFLTALPPPPPPNEDVYERLVEPPRLGEAPLAQVCIVSDEHQLAGPVRRLFDRWRTAVQLCHLRRHFVYGDAAATSVPLSLNATLALCQQVLVVVSPELLADPWTKQRLVPALTARLTTLAFRGTVMLLETGAAVAHLCREERFCFYEQLRRQQLMVALTWPSVETNWRLLEDLLLADVTETGEALAMDEEEFTQRLCRPAFRLTDADVEASKNNIFEQNRARSAAMTQSRSPGEKREP